MASTRGQPALAQRITDVDVLAGGGIESVDRAVERRDGVVKTCSEAFVDGAVVAGLLVVRISAMVAARTCAARTVSAMRARTTAGAGSARVPRDGSREAGASGMTSVSSGSGSSTTPAPHGSERFRIRIGKR